MQMEEPNTELDKIPEKLPTPDGVDNFNPNSMPSEARKIFVGNLAINLDKETLAKHFEKYGEIEDIDLRGRFAFINFMDVQSANDAVREMHNECIRDQKIVCQHHHPSNRNRRPGYFPGRRDNFGGPFFKRGRTQHRVIVRSLDPRCTWQNLKDFGRIAGDVNFANVYTFEGKKIGLIEYNTQESQKYAITELPNRLLNDRHVQVEEDSGQYDYLIQPRKRERSPNYRPRHDYYRYEDMGPPSYHHYDRYPSPTYYNKERMMSTSGRHHTNQNGRFRSPPPPYFAHGNFKNTSSQNSNNGKKPEITPPHILGSHLDRRVDEPSRINNRINYDEQNYEPPPLRYRSNEPPPNPTPHHHPHYYHGESPSSSHLRPPSHPHNVENYRIGRDTHPRDRRYYSNSMDSPKRGATDNYYRSDRNVHMDGSRFLDRNNAHWIKQRPTRDKYDTHEHFRYEYSAPHSRSGGANPRDEVRKHDMPADRGRYNGMVRFGDVRMKPGNVIVKEPTRGHVRRERSRSPDATAHTIRYGTRGGPR